MNPEVLFFTEDIDFQIDSVDSLVDWIMESIRRENKNCGTLNFIFCSDNYLLEINQSYLKHDTFTDIITFNYVEKDTISGDIFISIDRVRENAKELQTEFYSELKRVIIHGVLHLIGYNDKTSSETQEIRGKEDFYLALYPH